MIARPRRPSRAGCRNREGVAAVEFAIIVSLLLLLMAGGYDMSRLMTARRDAQRAAVEISQTLAVCTTSPCVLDAGQSIMNAQQNAFVTTSTLTISWAYVSRVNADIIVSFGNMTYLPTDVLAEAKSVLPGNNDNGVCSLITAKITSIGILQIWPNDAFGEQRYFVCTLQSKNVKVV